MKFFLTAFLVLPYNFAKSVDNLRIDCCADQSSEKRVQTCIFRRLELLPEEEQEVVLTKLRGAEALSDTSVKEQNELLMMLLRAHCESKQSRHVHDTAENR